MRSLLFIFVIFSSFSCFGQEKEQDVQQVEVNFIRLKSYAVDSIHSYIKKSEIDALQPNDLGDLLQKIPGTNVKSYGGLGGLKTISVRGLGSNHTSVVIDGFREYNTQTGQINLSQIQLDNVEQVVIQRGGSSETMIPVSSQLFGNSILINTYQSKKPSIPLEKKVISKVGSFGQIDHHFIGKTGSQKFYGSVSTKFRHANGQYPYELPNFSETVSSYRKNNDYTDLNAGIDFHYAPSEKHSFNFYYRFFQADQGLPGAVILYNDFSKSRLFSSNKQLKLDYNGRLKKLTYRIYLNRTRDSLLYRDPNYLNANKQLTSSYVNTINSAGLTVGYSIVKGIYINAGTEQNGSSLYGFGNISALPYRYHNFSFIKTTLSKFGFLLNLQLGSQFVKEENATGLSATNHFGLNPYIELRKKIGKKLSFYGYYRSSFRMPTFNELYYNSIGNLKLNPEKANQFALGASFKIIDKRKVYLGIQSGAYYHQVNDMILAIPTKNLFVWSIQNIGASEIKGVDVILSNSWAITKKLQSSFLLNFTYQQTLDVSDPNSPTYNNQIAYSPIYFGNIDWTLQLKNTGLRFSNFFSSERYSLNENIISNRLDGFHTLDVSLFTDHPVNEHNKIRLQLTIKNITNTQYSVVRNFVMPGINYLITFRYAFK